MHVVRTIAFILVRFRHNRNAMSTTLTLKLGINGDFPDNTMVDWVIRRARLLDLSGWIEFQNTTRIELQASGDRVLVEALEVACSLGPVNAQVHSITQREIPTPESFYRQRQQFVRYSPQRQPQPNNRL